MLVRSQKQTSFVQIETGFFCETDVAMVLYRLYMYSGHICLFARVIQQCLDSTYRVRNKFKLKSTTSMSGAAPSALRLALDSIIQASLCAY